MSISLTSIVSRDAFAGALVMHAQVDANRKCFACARAASATHVLTLAPPDD